MSHLRQARKATVQFLYSQEIQANKENQSLSETWSLLLEPYYIDLAQAQYKTLAHLLQAKSLHFGEYQLKLAEINQTIPNSIPKNHLVLLKQLLAKESLLNKTWIILLNTATQANKRKNLLIELTDFFEANQFLSKLYESIQGLNIDWQQSPLILTFTKTLKQLNQYNQRILWIQSPLKFKKQKDILHLSRRIQKIDSLQSTIQDYLTPIAQSREAIDQSIINHLENFDFKRLKTVDKQILRLSTYELLFSPKKQPAKIIFNEAIELAKELGDTDSSSFINGVLDTLNHSANV